DLIEFLSIRTGGACGAIYHVGQTVGTGDAEMIHRKSRENSIDRRDFIGGLIIMGQDERALIRLWQEKRGEVEPEDLSTNLIIQLKDVHCRVKHPVIRWMDAASTLLTWLLV